MDFTDIMQAAQNGEDISAMLENVIADGIAKGIEKQNTKKEPAYKAKEVLIEEAIEKYFDKDYKANKSLTDVKNEILHKCNKSIQMDNAGGTHEKYKNITKLSEPELSQILPYLYTFKNVMRSSLADEDTSDLMVRNDKGWYEPAQKTVKRTAYELAKGISLTKDIKEIIEKLKNIAGDAVLEDTNDNRTPLLNGIYDKDYFAEHGELIKYSDDEIVVNPLNVNFNPDATDPVIDFGGEQFNIEDWLLELAAGREDVKKLLWQCLSAIMHPTRNYKKAVILFSPFGNNGKGTFLELCRNLVGKKLCADLPIESFKDKSLVVNLADARLVTGDENAVDVYIDNITNFKNAVTGDPITVDRKYINSLTFSFRGLILQCMNSLPSTKDKTNSFYRRLLPIPFDSNFEGIEKDEIKTKYIKDKRVLEYIARKALLMDVQPGDFEISEAVENLLNEYKENNDTILQWWNDEGKDAEYRWDRLPYRFLYGSYKWWCKQNTTRQEVNLSKTKFTQEFNNKILKITDEWEATKFGVTKEMREAPEPLIAKYNIDELKNPNYTGKDWYKIGYAVDTLKKTENGIVRKGVLC